jgi:hypothetical protein
MECGQEVLRERIGRVAAEEPDHWHRGLLRARGERPRRRRASEQRDEVAPPHHSITSSARANIDSYLFSAEMNVFPDGPTPVIWMITSPSLAHV